MRRKLFTLAAGVFSAVLCAGVCALWVRSYWIEDAAVLSRGWDYANFASFRGEIGCEFGRWYDGGPRNFYAPEPHIRYERQLVEAPSRDYIHVVEAEGRFGAMPHYHDVWGFRWHPRSDRNWEYRERGVALPAWSLALLLGVLPAWRSAAFLRGSRRPTRGLCSRCGYDLRATPDRCPECGAVPAAASSSS